MTNIKIKQVSLSLFAHKGYEGTSLADIAKEVGIKKPSIYSHFKGKDDLFLSIFKEVIEKENLFIKSHTLKIEKLSVQDNLYTILKHFCELEDIDETLFFKRTLFFPPENLKTEIKQLIISHENLLRDLLMTIFTKGIKENTIKQKDISVLLSSYICLIDGLIVEKQIYTNKEYKEKINEVWTVFWIGITNI